MFNLGSSYFHVALTTVRHLLTVNSWVLVIFSRGGGTEVIFLLLWWIIISLSFLTRTHDLRLRQTKLFFSPFTSVHSALMRSVHGTVSIKV